MAFDYGNVLVRIFKTKFVIGVLGLMLCSLLARLIVLVGLQPPLPHLSRQNVPLVLLGYTNGETPGTQLAIFAVTNLSIHDIRVYRPFVMLMVSNVPQWSVYTASNWPRFRSLLGRGASAEFTVSVPTNRSPWRVNLLAAPDVGATRSILRKTLGYANRMPYGINSDWITDKK